MIGTTRVSGERVSLEPMNESFVTDRYVSWLNDPVVTRFLQSRNQTSADLAKYVAVRVGDENVRFWAITDKSSGLHIGNVKLEPIFWQARTAVFGLLLGDKSYWGKGYASEVTALVVRHAFETLELNRVELGVEAENAAAIRSYEKVGFKTAIHPKGETGTKWMIAEKNSR